MSIGLNFRIARYSGLADELQRAPRLRILIGQEEQFARTAAYSSGANSDDFEILAWQYREFIASTIM
jgi:hypothetical protein